MNKGPSNAELRHRLLKWFDANARDLPWRRTCDPYAIWVSEVMLQQTRVAAVLEHYARFMKRFPTLRNLAAAGEEEVLAHWSGLGYYRRARLLHKAAQLVARDPGARLPATAAELRSLPGIGEYTSAAIASIAFGEAVACVDGNVERVLLRLRGWDERSVTAAKVRADALHLLDEARPGDFNQAMMELGATICLPRAPLCLECPVIDSCATRGEHPVKARKKARRRLAACALLQRSSARRPQVLLEQRPLGSSLMPGMWELPAIDPNSVPQDNEPITLRHSITDTNYSVSVYVLKSKQHHLLPRNGAVRQWFSHHELHRLPLTGLTRKALKRLNQWPESQRAVKNADSRALTRQPRPEIGAE